MGYTHYWTTHRQATPDEWSTLMKQAVRVLNLAKKAGIELGDWKGEGFPLISDQKICFNGRAPDDFETFSITPSPSEFEFCKTGRRDYDAVVVAILELAKAQGFLTWRSDGDPEDHAQGLKFAKSALAARSA
jgi:hypothetical protein